MNPATAEASQNEPPKKPITMAVAVNRVSVNMGVVPFQKSTEIRLKPGIGSVVTDHCIGGMEKALRFRELLRGENLHQGIQ
jgi:hypothetical protein